MKKKVKLTTQITKSFFFNKIYVNLKEYTNWYNWILNNVLYYNLDTNHNFNIQNINKVFNIMNTNCDFFINFLYSYYNYYMDIMFGDRLIYFDYTFKFIYLLKFRKNLF